jgi:(R,R)-butanediol dehydrogenase/meso-butanediol dehydrogenase/diacetyl reductase
VTTIAVGDRVSIQPLIMPRVGDYYAERGLFHLSDQLALAGLSWQWGGMSEAAIVHEYNVAKIPDSLSDEEAALVEPGGRRLCLRSGRGPRGQQRSGNGAGPIGLLTLLAARAAGATRLFVSDLNDARLAFAEKAVPGVIPINPKRDNVGDVVRDQSEGKVGCDVAIECVGNEHALKACVDAVRKQGVVVQTGLHPHENPLDWFSVTFKDIEVRGSWAYPTWYWPRVIDLIASGALPPAGRSPTRSRWIRR